MSAVDDWCVPPKFAMIFLSAAMVWSVPPCQSASPPHQFLSRFPSISDKNLDDCGVIFPCHHHHLPWWWWHNRKKTEVCGRDACAVVHWGDGPRRATAFCVGSWRPVWLESRFCSIIFGRDVAKRSRGGGVSYGSKISHFWSCVMWFGVGLLFGKKLDLPQQAPVSFLAKSHFLWPVAWFQPVLKKGLARGDLTGWAKNLVKILTVTVLVQCSLFIAFLDRSCCPAHSPSIFFELLQFLTELWSFEIIYNMG